MHLSVQSASGRRCVYGKGGDIAFFFSVYVTGNSSAVLLNNETYVCVCVYISVTKSLLNK